MKNECIKEKVSAGLRAVKVLPDAFVFTRCFDWVWDRPKIFGIPVFHSDLTFPCYSEGLGEECPFIPIWRNEIEMYSESYAFRKAYEAMG